VRVGDEHLIRPVAGEYEVEQAVLARIDPRRKRHPCRGGQRRERRLEIARCAGYQDNASFSKAFKREFGQAPGAYRDGTRQPLAIEIA